MTNQQHCQSCGMPMAAPEDFGKQYDGTKSEDFCCHCYPEGMFNNPQETLAEMVATCAPYLVESGDSPNLAAATEMLEAFLPTLKRWKPTGQIITFHLKEGTTPEAFLAASDRLQSEFLSQAPGFISRQLMVIDGVWTDWVIWQTMGAAEAAMHNSMSHEAGQAFLAMVGDVVEQQYYPLERAY